MRNLLGVRISLTLAGVAFAVVFAVAAGYDRTLVLGTAIAGAGLLLQSLQTLVAVPLTARLRLGWATVADLVRQVTFVGLTLTLVVLGATLLPFFVVAVPASLAALGLTAVLVRRMTPFRPAFDRREWWRLIRDTIPYAAAIAVNVAYFRLAIVFMSLLATELETGYFAASFRILEVLLPVPSVIVGAVFPILVVAARDDRARLAYASQRIFEVAVIAGAGMVLVIELAAPTIVAVLAGEAGKPSVEVLRIQAPALAATFVAVACGFPLLSLHRHRALLIANLVALAVSVTLCLALIGPLGARGAALATTIAEVALAAVTLTLLLRATPEHRLSIGILGAVALAAGIGALALLLPVPALLQAIAAGLAYLGVLAAAGPDPPRAARRVRAPGCLTAVGDQDRPVRRLAVQAPGDREQRARRGPRVQPERPGELGEVAGRVEAVDQAEAGGGLVAPHGQVPVARQQPVDGVGHLGGGRDAVLEVLGRPRVIAPALAPVRVIEPPVQPGGGGVGRERHDHPAARAQDAQHLGEAGGALVRRDVLEHLERQHDVEGTVREGERRGGADHGLEERGAPLRGALEGRVHAGHGVLQELVMPADPAPTSRIRRSGR
jgi:O-antigen/teichoic acid export membrane protein